MPSFPLMHFFFQFLDHEILSKHPRNSVGAILLGLKEFILQLK